MKLPIVFSTHLPLWASALLTRFPLGREKITLKTNDEILLMREAGLITGRSLEAVKKAIVPGISTLELDAIAEATIHSFGAKSNFKLVAGYHHTICASINDEVVHGVPSKDRILAPGDIISIAVSYTHLTLPTIYSV